MTNYMHHLATRDHNSKSDQLNELKLSNVFNNHDRISGKSSLPFMSGTYTFCAAHVCVRACVRHCVQALLHDRGTQVARQQWEEICAFTFSHWNKMTCQTSHTHAGYCYNVMQNNAHISRNKTNHFTVALRDDLSISAFQTLSCPSWRTNKKITHLCFVNVPSFSILGMII